MNCTEFERRLNTLLDQRDDVQADAILQSHASQCEDCQVTLSLHTQIVSLWRPAQGTSSPGSRLDSHGPTARPTVVDPVMPASLIGDRTLISAASALVAVVLATVVLVFGGGERLARQADPLENAISASRSVVPDNTAPNGDVWLLQLRELPITRVLGDGRRLLATDVTWHPLGDGFVPVTNSVVSALNVLRRTWPTSDLSDHPADASATHHAQPTG